MNKNTGHNKEYKLRPLYTLKREKICRRIGRSSEYDRSKVSNNRSRKSIDSPGSQKCIHA